MAFTFVINGSGVRLSNTLPFVKRCDLLNSTEWILNLDFSSKDFKGRVKQFNMLHQNADLGPIVVLI